MLPAPVLALLIGATWFVPMVARHGIEPLLSGLTSRGGLEPIGSLVLLARLVLYPPNMAAIIGMVGLVLASRDRRWDLLGLLAVSALGVGQSGRWTIIPLAVLAGYALNIAFAHFPSRAGAALGGVAVATAVAGVVWAQAEHTLTPEERATMEWVRQETSPCHDGRGNRSSRRWRGRRVVPGSQRTHERDDGAGERVELDGDFGTRPGPESAAATRGACRRRTSGSSRPGAAPTSLQPSTRLDRPCSRRSNRPMRTEALGAHPEPIGEQSRKRRSGGRVANCVGGPSANDALGTVFP